MKFKGLTRNIGYEQGLFVVSAVRAVLIAGIRGSWRFFAILDLPFSPVFYGGNGLLSGPRVELP